MLFKINDLIKNEWCQHYFVSHISKKIFWRYGQIVVILNSLNDGSGANDKRMRDKPNKFYNRVKQVLKEQKSAARVEQGTYFENREQNKKTRNKYFLRNNKFEISVYCGLPRAAFYDRSDSQ